VRKNGGESVDDLAASILAHGLLQNLTVVEQSDTRGKHTGKYAVITGGRRFVRVPI
jgi:ParB family transcriptional regulator, chromosome partitioning protein